MRRLFILCGLIAFAGKPASSCMVELSQSHVVVRFGDPLFVNCNTSSNQSEGLGWESTVSGIGLQRGVFSLPLNISSVSQWSIEAFCFNTFVSGDQCEKPLGITIYKTPDSVSMIPLSPLASMIAGEAIIVQCDIVNVAPARNLTVRWYKGNQEWRTETFNDPTREAVNKSVISLITAHGDDNGTQIWCEAELDFEPVGQNPPAMRSAPQEVIVLYPPVLAAPENETLEIPPGSKIILNCTAKGNPMPAYNWQFPNPTPQTNKDENANGPILNPSLQLPGPYACTASNRLGSKTKYFMVIEAARDRTTFAALVGGFVALGVVIAIVGLLLLTPNGTFSCNKGSYLRGQPI